MHRKGARAIKERRLQLLKRLITVLCSFVCGCGAGQQPPDDDRIGAAADAIAGGVADKDNDAVVAIGSDEGGLCSGVLIGERTVLTARHCVAVVSDGGDHVRCGETIFGAPRQAESFRVMLGEGVDAAGDAFWLATLKVAEVTVPGTGLPFCGNDIALLHLDHPVDASIASPIEPRFAEPSLAKGERYTAVGYGALNEHGEGDGVRRRREGLAVLCLGESCWGATELGDHVVAAEWAGEGGVCGGDSGGPALDADGRVIGVTSRGMEGCGVSVYTQLLPHRDWMIDTVLDATAEGQNLPSWVAAGEDETEAGCNVSTRAGVVSNNPPLNEALWWLVSAFVVLGLRRRRLHISR